MCVALLAASLATERCGFPHLTSRAPMTASLPNARPLAYNDAEFLDSAAGRPVRIVAEYLQPLEVFRRERIRDTIVFYGSARLAEYGPLGHYYAAARELARLVTVW